MQKYTNNKYHCGGFYCGCNFETDYREDCYFYNEEHDMGAKIPLCRFDDEFKPLNKCPKDCKAYILKSKVYSIVKNYIKEKAF